MHEVLKVLQAEIAKAKRQQALQIAKNLLEILTPEEIAKRTGLTVEEVQKLAKLDNLEKLLLEITHENIHVSAWESDDEKNN